MPEINASPFAGFIQITPPLSKAERDYINAFKSTRRVDRVQGPYYVSRIDPASDAYVIDPDTPSYGQPSVWCQWEITEDGSRIVFDEDENEFENPIEWMVYLIDHFLSLKPFAMEEFPQVRRDYGVPDFTGHICNGHIQCRKHHNIVVENNRVGRELSWPNGKVEWLNDPEPVFGVIDAPRPKRSGVDVLKINGKQDSRDKHYSLPSFEDMIDPAKLSPDGTGGNQYMVGPSLLDIWNKAKKIDGWKEDQPVTEITREDVEILKADWEADPIWDLEGTEGFEAYRDELKTFFDAKKAEWEARREQDERKRIAKIHEKADELGCSFGVAQYIANLEGRIKHLERQVGVLLEHSDEAYREVRGF
jgi:hypothetical protein